MYIYLFLQLLMILPVIYISISLLLSSQSDLWSLTGRRWRWAMRLFEASGRKQRPGVGHITWTSNHMENDDSSSLKSLPSRSIYLYIYICPYIYIHWRSTLDLFISASDFTMSIQRNAGSSTFGFRCGGLSGVDGAGRSTIVSAVAAGWRLWSQCPGRKAVNSWYSCEFVMT